MFRTVLITILVSTAVSLGVLFFPSQKFGAIIGPILYFPFFNHNGVYTFSYKVGLSSATNTVCAIRSPEATSTLKHGSITLSTSTPVASIVEIAKATTPYATTTRLGSLTLGAGNYGSLLATTTLDNAATPNLVFSPLSWLVVNVGAKYGGVPNGHCEAVWIVM